MNVRERILAVVQGRKHDRVPFVQYDGIAGPNEEIWSTIGRENMGVLRWITVHRTESRNCRWDAEEIWDGDLRGVRHTLHTPAGSITKEAFYERALGTAVIRKHFIQEPEDYHALIAYFRDLLVFEDLSQIVQCERELGNDGLPHVRVDRTPFQQLWIEWASLSDLCLHMADYPELMADVLLAIGGHLKKVFEVVRNTPIPYVVFPDNITAPAIGERYFREYCLPYYAELADMLSDRDVPIYVHMDGDLKPLWSAIGDSRVLGLDSLSPPPDNDTSVGDAARLWPEMRLGVNFPSSVHLGSPDVIREAVERILSEAGHTGRLQIQISENMPRDGWRKSFPIIIEAIRNFGAPGSRGG